MKNKICRVLLSSIILLLTVGVALLLFRFAWPMEDRVYNLSASVAEGQDEAEDKGWEVFTQEGSTKTILTPNGIGGFSGLSYPGQTFYFSRVIDEELESATLRLEMANRTVAVYLDSELLYTDCPEQDGDIGSLTLPMLEYDRTEAVLVTLPTDYTGKILTIAQSTDPGGRELQGAQDTVWPCDITLYCGYAYESGLIAESFRAAIPASLLFAVGCAVLTAFCLLLWRGKMDWSLLCIALTIFLYAVWAVYSTPYAGRYYSVSGIDTASLCQRYALLTLLVFFTLRGRQYRSCLWILTGLQGLWCILATLPAFINVLHTNSFYQNLLSYHSELEGVLGMLAAVVLGMVFWRKESLFYRIFAPLTLAGIVAYLIWVCLSPLAAPAWWKDWIAQLQVAFQMFLFGHFRWLLMNLTVCTAAAGVLAEFLLQEARRRTEARLLSDRIELAQINYENLRTHNEEIMMLRHDMKNHLNTLRGISDPEQAAIYLDELIGQNEKIRPVIQSGNEMLDILLNGKLAPAAASGMKIEIIRMQAPKTLPLSDTEISSLILNILDNSVKAASAVEHPVIWLDLHCKSDFFVFTCENTTIQKQSEEETAPPFGHGLGLKIIRQLIDRYEGLITTEQMADSYKLTIAIPISQDSR